MIYSNLFALLLAATTPVPNTGDVPEISASQATSAMDARSDDYLIDLGRKVCGRMRNRDLSVCLDTLFGTLPQERKMNITWDTSKTLLEDDSKKEDARLARAREACRHRWKVVGEPVIGMTGREAVDCGWGRPYDINRTRTANSSEEQWVYPGQGYLYFRGGRVVTIQD